MRILLILFGAIIALHPQDLGAQQVVQDAAYVLSLPAGWERTVTLPPGNDAGFRKRLAKGETATLYLHHELMPPEAGNPPSDTEGMKRKWDSLILKQFPDMRQVHAKAPRVNGAILINGTYELTDNGVKLLRRYTYFLSGRTAFVVQCSAPPSQWPAMLNDFDAILASLKPGSLESSKGVESEGWVEGELNVKLPVLFSTFPSRWMCSLVGVSVASPSPETGRTLHIEISFDRLDIEEIYHVTKLLVGMAKAGRADADPRDIPDELRAAASSAGEFLEHLGQVWGVAWNYIASCRPPVAWYKVSILDSKDRRIGSISISREDARTILSGRVTPEQPEKLFGMYLFE